MWIKEEELNSMHSKIRELEDIKGKLAKEITDKTIAFNKEKKELLNIIKVLLSFAPEGKFEIDRRLLK